MHRLPQPIFDIYALSLPRGHAFGDRPPIEAWQSEDGLAWGTVMDEGTKQGLNTIQSWLFPQPPKRKAASQLYFFEVTAQEKEIIESGLRECQGRVFGPSGAAAKLGFAWSTLESKIRSLKIDKNRFRPHRGT